MKLGLIRPITLWPYPKKAFEALGPQVKAFLDIEMNILGQMTRRHRPGLTATSIPWNVMASIGT